MQVLRQIHECLVRMSSTYLSLNPLKKQKYIWIKINSQVRETLQILYMDKEEVLRQLQELQEKYPENLNDNYRCYWWCTCDLDGNILTYYLTLRDNIFPESESER